MKIRLSIALAGAVALAAAAADFKPVTIKTGELRILGANTGSTSPPGAPAAPKPKKEKPRASAGKTEPAPSPSNAANFTFTVPLTVVNVPSATRAVVFCTVSRVNLTGTFPFAAKNIAGNGSTSQPLTGGAFSGSVNVMVNVDKAIPPSAARSYACNISLNGRSTAGPPYVASFANMADAVLKAAGQTLTTTQTSVSGVIPERP